MLYDEWRKHMGIEPTREISHPPHRFWRPGGPPATDVLPLTGFKFSALGNFSQSLNSAYIQKDAGKCFAWSLTLNSIPNRLQFFEKFNWLRWNRDDTLLSKWIPIPIAFGASPGAIVVFGRYIQNYIPLYCNGIEMQRIFQHVPLSRISVADGITK